MRILFIILLLAVPCYSQDVEPNEPIAVITGPTDTAAGELVEYDAGDSTGSGYDWLVISRQSTANRYRVSESGRYLYFASPEIDTYYIVLSVAQGDKSDVVTWVLNNGTDPNPDVDPIDPPLPNKQWQVVIIYERGELDDYSPQQQSIIKSLTFRKKLIEAGHSLVEGGVTDKDTVDRTGVAPRKLLPYLSACKGTELPRICIASPTGGTVQDFYIPKEATDESILALLGGAK